MMKLHWPFDWIPRANVIPKGLMSVIPCQGWCWQQGFCLSKYLMFHIPSVWCRTHLAFCLLKGHKRPLILKLEILSVTFLRHLGKPQKYVSPHWFYYKCCIKKKANFKVRLDLPMVLWSSIIERRSISFPFLFHHPGSSPGVETILQGILYYIPYTKYWIFWRSYLWILRPIPGLPCVQFFFVGFDIFRHHYLYGSICSWYFDFLWHFDHMYNPEMKWTQRIPDISTNICIT